MAVTNFVVEIDGSSYEVDLAGPAGTARINGREFRIDLQPVGAHGHYSLLVEDRPYEAYVDEAEDGYSVTIRGEHFQTSVKTARDARLAAVGGKRPEAPADKTVRAPLPGLVVSVNAAPGEAVRRGQVLVVLEAMKMQNDLAAPADATVKEMPVKVGDKVQKGAVLFSLE